MWQLKNKFVTLTEDEKQEINVLVLELMDNVSQIDFTSILPKVAVYAQEMSRRLRQVFYDFKLYQQEHTLCVQLGAIATTS